MKLITIDKIVLNPDAIDFVSELGENECIVHFRNGTTQVFGMIPAQFAEVVRKRQGNET